MTEEIAEAKARAEAFVENLTKECEEQERQRLREMAAMTPLEYLRAREQDIRDLDEAILRQKEWEERQRKHFERWQRMQH